tara:strand:+ start:682 stop:792 length:111 start_codon:yes stop_codon:yes gene_type:complete
MKNFSAILGNFKPWLYPSAMFMSKPYPKKHERRNHG